jgi:threonine/homoserine/homoserine lactone efflux protein|tara:strand:- start:146 stop:748 length:603 start_codon:yes stop_codon:yes gene_type:complete
MSVGIISFVAFAFSQVATPGPANMSMLATGARYGFRAALPFVAGVVLGKQLIIWPIGFGLMSLADQVPLLFVLLKYVSAAYIIWLAWRVANMRLSVNKDTANAPGFVAGLWVHPLNPKAWAMIVAGFTNFVDPSTPTLTATAIIALSLMGIQIICHPVWTFFGDRIARLLIGTPSERYLMWCLAALTVAFVGYALMNGEL